ncbi:mycothiol synthase [Subtercola sp. RTI3]|uniref:mycothiol synthase n=1 Tax=Subtercola sp. RTI3 TaxID=3048639 RepID=UPI002B23439E|nr:mycothiol synthase [Subtercola sp. RTI3]MEA9985812.1 mycothiol synthase [Subtercola sp. RTI3]
MTASLGLAEFDPEGAAHVAALTALLSRAALSDGQPPFNDQTLADARAGTNFVVLAFEGDRLDSDSLVGAAAVTDDTLELVIAPDARRRGHGEALTAHMLTSRTGPLLVRLLEPFVAAHPAPTLAWAHGDHPGARALAARHDFEPVRTLLQLRMPLTAEMPPTTGVTRVEAFVPGQDDEAWVELNARVFHGHPEQGRLTVDDLHARMADDWFDANDFLVARSPDGEMIGYNWLKVEPGDTVGEIYVIGVDASHSGQGLGRELMLRGLSHLLGRGCRTAALYVEEDNTPAVPLYRSLGFTDHTIDVQYRRR